MMAKVKELFSLLRDRFRQQRYQYIQDAVKVENLNNFVMDLGGGIVSFFVSKFPKPEQILLVDLYYNTALAAKKLNAKIQVVVANGENLPFANSSIDMSICNSVIEHVTNPDKLAAEIQRVSKGYFLQTPNGNFPLETHSFIAIPFYNFIPSKRVRKLICRLFGAEFERVNSVKYLSIQKLKSLFPEATVTYERVLGLKKSFYIYYTEK